MGVSLGELWNCKCFVDIYMVASALHNMRERKAVLFIKTLAFYKDFAYCGNKREYSPYYFCHSLWSKENRGIFLA